METVNFVCRSAPIWEFSLGPFIENGIIFQTRSAPNFLQRKLVRIFLGIYYRRVA